MLDITPWRGRELGRLREDMDNLFERFFAGFPWVGFPKRVGVTPLVDLSETKDEIIVKTEIPGVGTEDVDISLSGNILSIKGEKSQEKVDEDEGFHRAERFYGSFSRSLTLPCDVEENKITATYEKGVLKIKLPKREESKPKRIKIDVK